MSRLPVPGVRVGHWTGASTGVTVVVLPPGTIGSGEARGGAPATRELTLLDPGRTVTQVDAVVFTGGSAFGLATADGVMRFLAARGRGYPTSGGPVPIVPTAAIYDLAEASGPRPGPTEGYAAAALAERDEPAPRGRVGAGAGATVGKWRGRAYAVPGGIGLASAQVDGATVAALAVVNAVGDVVGADGNVVAGSTAAADAPAFPDDRPFEEGAARASTTLVFVVTDGRIDKHECHLVAQSAHDGFPASLRPAHTRFDGDVAIAASTGRFDIHLDRLRAVTAEIVAAAIRDALSGG